MAKKREGGAPTRIPSGAQMRSQKFVVLPGQIAEDFGSGIISLPGTSVDPTVFSENLAKRGVADFATMLSLLKKMAQNERAKEIAFLTSLYNDPIFKSELSPLVQPLHNALKKAMRGGMGEQDFTEIFTLLETTEQGLKNVTNLIDTYKNARLDEKFTSAMLKELTLQAEAKKVKINNTDIIPDLDVDLTQIMYNALKTMQNKTFDLRKPDVREAAFQEINLVLESQGFLPLNKKIKMDEFGHYKTDLKSFLEHRGERKKDGLKGKTVKDLIKSATKELAKGIGAEMFIALSSEGLGKISSRQLTGFSSINDVESVVTLSTRLNDNLTKGEFFDYDRLIKQFKITEKQVNAMKSNFKIAYSSKMYMPDVISETNSHWRTDSIKRDYKITGTSSISAKKKEILELAQETGVGDIEDLLFMLNNIGSGALYHGQKQTVESTLATIAATWMFGESNEMFMEVIGDFSKSNSTDTTTLHLFVLNGVYMPISNILYKLIEQLQKKERKRNEDIVKVSISEYNSIGYYTENIRRTSNLMGLARWEALKTEVEHNTKIKIELNKSLLSDFLSF